MRGASVLLFRGATRLWRWSQLRFTPLGRVVLGGTLAAAAFGIDIRQSAALQLAALGAGMLAVALLFALRFKPQVSVERTLPAYVTAGIGTAYDVRIRNLSTQRALPALAIRESLDPGLPDRTHYAALREPAHADNWLDRVLGLRRWLRLLRWHRGALIQQASLPALRPGTEATIKLQLQPLRRGYVQFAGLVLLRPEPLGLINAIACILEPASLLVLPRRYRVPKVTLGHGRRHQSGGMSRAGKVGDTQEFLALRDYFRGDPMRHIHWRSWAKTGTPVVKQFQDEYCSRQALVLDTFGEPGARFEAAISITASFVMSEWHVDSVIDLLLIGTEAVHAQTGRAGTGRSRLLELLACAVTAPGTNIEALSRLVLRSAEQLSAAILVLLDWDNARRELVHQLRARNVPLVVIVIGDATDDPWPEAAHDEERFCVVRPEHIERDLGSLAMRTPRARRAGCA